LATLGIAQVNLALPSFAQNLFPLGFQRFSYTASNFIALSR